MRCKWFPIFVLIAAGVWWSGNARYYTLLHVIVVLAAITAICIWWLACGSGGRRRRIATVASISLGIAALLIVFRPVYNGDMGIYRWRLRFAKAADESLPSGAITTAIADVTTSPTDYPGFLGGGYWAEVKDVELEIDWLAHRPQEMWRHKIGAGWSAFAIVGDYAFTQEQRGENELVTCYQIETGAPVWIHADKARFDPADAVGGLGDIGPRATPTVSSGRVFAQGGTGIVNCLDARTGKVVWSHDTCGEFGVPVATWGKSGSPLVVGGTVVISVGAPSGAPSTAAADVFDSSLVAFDINTGRVAWHAGTRRASYASPVLATLSGERQIVVVNEKWVTSHRATDGVVLWEHPWANENDDTATCPQPVPVGNDRLFLSKGYGVGCSLILVKRDEAGKFSAQPLWEPAIKKVMKNKFSNSVLRDGFVYGLDDVLLECIELESGNVKWKKRRTPVFGHGQLMLIGDTIVVLSETGELVLVEAKPSEYRELAHIQALDDANVTWNSLAFAAPYLLVRNAREAVCYRLPLRSQ